MAAGFVVVSGLVLSTPVPPRETPVVASGALGSSLTGPGSAGSARSGASGVLVRVGASPDSVTEASPAPGAPGLRILATPMADRTLSMTETATFTRRQTSVVLKPPAPGDAGAKFHATPPTVEKVVVYADGQLVMTLADLSVPMTLSLPHGASTVRVTYVLSGAFTAASSNPHGVTALQPLLSSPAEPLPVSYTVGGDGGTASIVCPQLPFFRQACGTTAGVLSGLPADKSLVVITLGPPAAPVEPAPAAPAPPQTQPPVTSPSDAPTGGPGGGTTTDPTAPAGTSPSSPGAPVATTPDGTPSPPVEPLPSPTVTPTDSPTSSVTPPPPDPTSVPPTTAPTTDPAPPPPTDPTTTPTTSPPPTGTEKQQMIVNGPPGTEMQASTDPTASVPTAAPTATSTATPTATVPAPESTSPAPSPTLGA